MLKDQRLKKVIKQIAGDIKNIDHINLEDFVYDGKRYRTKNIFSLFCVSKIFPIELSAYEDQFFKNNYLIRPAYEMGGESVNSLDLKHMLWAKFNLNIKSINFLPAEEIQSMQQPENYFKYNNGVYYIRGAMEAADIIEHAILSDYVILN